MIMDHSWRNNSQENNLYCSSPSVSSDRNYSCDSTDFLSFNDANIAPNYSPNNIHQRFFPQTYSSPRRSFSGNNMRFSRNHRGSSRNFNRKYPRTNWNRNQSFNSSQNNENISSYYDPTCTDDPWLELEKNLSSSSSNQSNNQPEEIENVKTSSSSIKSSNEVVQL